MPTKARQPATAPKPRPLPGASGPATASGTLSAAWDGTGTAPANSYVSLPVGDQGTVSCQITGTWSETNVFEGTVDNTNYVAIKANALGSDTLVTTTTANGVFILGAGMTTVRVRCSARASGTANVTLRATPGTSAVLPVSMAAGGGVGGGAVVIADGADTALGTTTDAGIITDIAGTVIGFLRGNILQWITQLSRMGSVTEAAPATDTASSGLNGRLQRIAQRLTSLLLTQSSADTVALASAARTTTQNIDLTANDLSRMLLTIDVTAGSGGGITPSINFKDPASGKYIILHAALTKITVAGTYTYAVGMGAPTAVGGITAVVPFSLPTTARITLTVDDATSYTYSVGYCRLP